MKQVTWVKAGDLRVCALQLQGERPAVEVDEQLGDAVLLHGVAGGEAVEVELGADLELRAKGAEVRQGGDMNDPRRVPGQTTESEIHCCSCLIQGSAKRWSPGCVNVACKARQKW